MYVLCTPESELEGRRGRLEGCEGRRGCLQGHESHLEEQPGRLKGREAV